MVIVSVCSLKGGVGKTSLVLGLAASAQRRELATLVVDLDPQGDATYALGVDVDGGDVSRVLERPKRKVLAESVVPSPWRAGPGELHVLPAGAATARFDRPEAEGKELHALRAALSKVDYDLVLIDSPPSLSGLTRSALVASDRVLVVTEPGAFAVHAVTRLLRAVDDVRRREAGWLQPLGIVVTKLRPRVREQARQVTALERLFGPLVLRPPIPDRAVTAQAQGARRPLTEFPTAGELVQLHDGILDKVLRAARRRR